MITMITPHSLHPARALLTPAWLAALALLALNDHALKQALPGLVTGKLSDLAGLFVAPTLLACVLVVRTRRGLLACHLAVGAVFAAIKLSRAAADLWIALMAALGVPWTIVVDPGDLLALPALWLSWRALAPVMRAPLARPHRRALASVTGGLGLLVCAATSPRRPHPELVPPPPLREDAVLIALTVRVEGTFELRCDEGTRADVAVRGDSHVYLPRPPAGAECKVQLLGATGSFGPLSADSRILQCNVSQLEFTCWPGH